MVKRLIYIAFSAVIVVTFVLGFYLKDLKFNYAFEDFFPLDDPELEYYREFSNAFGDDSNFLIIGLNSEVGTVYDTAFLSKVRALSDTLKVYIQIESVLSPATLRRPVISPAGIFRIPILHVEDQEKLRSDSIYIRTNPFWGSNLISKDGSSLAIILEHRKLYGKESTDSLLNFINTQVVSNGFNDYHFAGTAKAEMVFIEKMQGELLIFMGISIILVIVFLAYAYRSWYGVVVPLVVILLAVVWTTGAMAAFDKPLDILMVLLPTILFVVGTSDVVHIMTKYIEELRLGKDKLTAIKVTMKEVGLATFLTSLTTAVGFATLLTASVRPIREFGVFTAFGVFAAYFAAFTLMPSILALVGKPSVSRKKVQKSSWIGFLSWSFRKVMRSPGLIAVIVTAITAISILGISFLKVNTFLIEDIPSDDPLKVDYAHFDQKFGGTRAFELDIHVRDSAMDIFHPEIIRQIDKVDQYLEGPYEAGNIFSPAIIIKILNQATQGGISSEFRLPEDNWKAVNRNIRRVRQMDGYSRIITPDRSRGRITAKIGDIGSSLSLERAQQLREFIATNTDSTVVSFTITGTSNLVDKNNEYLARNMLQGLAIAFLVVAIIAGIMFKSVRMVFITLIPNVIPLIIIAGIMGYFGITLKLSTSIVFTIAFGIAVDDTLHFISKFRLELAKGKSKLYALKRTYLSTGKALIITSIILSGGFLTLILSDFGGTFYTGLLVSLTLVFALVIDLTLLPVLITIFYKTGKATRNS